jgi:hypothetical protein
MYKHFAFCLNHSGILYIYFRHNFVANQFFLIWSLAQISMIKLNLNFNFFFVEINLDARKIFNANIYYDTC